MPLKLLIPNFLEVLIAGIVVDFYQSISLQKKVSRHLKEGKKPRWGTTGRKQHQLFSKAAWAAASLATGTRGPEQDT